MPWESLGYVFWKKKLVSLTHDFKEYYLESWASIPTFNIIITRCIANIGGDDIQWELLKKQKLKRWWWWFCQTCNEQVEFFEKKKINKSKWKEQCALYYVLKKKLKQRDSFSKIFPFSSMVCERKKVMNFLSNCKRWCVECHQQ